MSEGFDWDVNEAMTCVKRSNLRMQDVKISWGQLPIPPSFPLPATRLSPQSFLEVTLCITHKKVHVYKPFTFPRLFSTLRGFRRWYGQPHILHMRMDWLRQLICRRAMYDDSSMFTSMRLIGGGRSRQRRAPGDEHAWLQAVALHHSIATPLETADLVDDCYERIASLPLNSRPIPTPVPRMELTRSDLLDLLSNNWLDDCHILAGIKYIIHSAAYPRIAATDPLHILCLSRARDRLEEGKDASLVLLSKVYTPLTPLDFSLLSGQVTELYIPLHENKNHWTLLHLNFTASAYSYADCKKKDQSKVEPPPDQCDLLAWWLDGLGLNFRALNKVLFPVSRLPHQLDNDSCGIIVLSLMASILLQHELWMPERAAIERMLWFLRLSSPPHDKSDVEPDFEWHHFTDTDEDDNVCIISVCSFDSLGNTVDSTHSFSLHPSFSSSPSSSTIALLPEALDPSIGTTSASSSVPFSSPSLTSLSYESSVASLKKRSSSSLIASPSSSDDESDTSDAMDYHQLKRHKGHGPRKGSSWAKQKALKVQAKDTAFEGHAMKLRNFRSKILEIDPHAELKEDDLCAVRCSACAGWLEMRAVYDILRFSEHRRGGKCQARQSTGMVSKSLFAMGFVRKTKEIAASKICTTPLPCPGLTRESDPNVNTYLMRTTATYGGALSRLSIAKSLFHDIHQWKDLSMQQRRMVIRRQEVLASWKIARQVEAVFSVKCEENVHTPVGTDPLPCPACKSLYKLPSFQAALRRPLPAEHNMKYVPKAYRNTALGEIYLKFHGVRELMEIDDGKSPWLKFAVGAAAGDYQSQTVLGMVEAFVLKAERLRRGKTLRNMKYSGAFSDFSDMLASLSPVAYRNFQAQFGGRTLEGLRLWAPPKPDLEPASRPSRSSIRIDQSPSHRSAGRSVSRQSSSSVPAPVALRTPTVVFPLPVPATTWSHTLARSSSVPGSFAPRRPIRKPYDNVSHIPVTQVESTSFYHPPPTPSPAPRDNTPAYMHSFHDCSSAPVPPSHQFPVPQIPTLPDPMTRPPTRPASLSSPRSIHPPPHASPSQTKLPTTTHITLLSRADDWPDWYSGVQGTIEHTGLWAFVAPDPLPGAYPDPASVPTFPPFIDFAVHLVGSPELEAYQAWWRLDDVVSHVITS
ncbi:hypothetical protein D9615_009810 [Tricholomella constricta]|uniref:Ubiquitin-like protease family profile domain-containing protein n=1 Tax=Tricholomella constricta TaxID=117010 RepID=A0A8H5GTJ2_9AGAR|nr:hypothetical protein D9615_009810 [Tricholomella constricta]